METIKKTVRSKNSKGQTITKEVEYRVDAAFKPKAAREICAEFIENYCVKHNEIDWLLETVQKKIVDKNGKEKDYPFIKIRADFVEKFFPQLKKQKKPLTFKEQLLAKYGK